MGIGGRPADSGASSGVWRSSQSDLAQGAGTTTEGRQKSGIARRARVLGAPGVNPSVGSRRAFNPPDHGQRVPRGPGRPGDVGRHAPRCVLVSAASPTPIAFYFHRYGQFSEPAVSAIQGPPICGQERGVTRNRHALIRTMGRVDFSNDEWLITGDRRLAKSSRTPRGHLSSRPVGLCRSGSGMDLRVGSWRVRCGPEAPVCRPDRPGAAANVHRPLIWTTLTPGVRCGENRSPFDRLR